MAQKLKFGNGVWANKEGSTLAYNDENGNYKPLPFNFTRSTSATRVNKQGLIEVVKNNKPRIDFQGNTKGALLLEPSRTNSALSSDNWSGTGWILDAATVTVNTVTSPSGSQDADTLTLSGEFGRLRQTFSSLSDNTSYTVSSFFKAGTAYSFKMIFFNKANTETAYAFNLQEGTCDSGASIEDYGNGWYRCSFSVDSGSGATTPSARFASHNTGFTGGWTTGLTIYAWGAQLEASYLTSYIPTSGSAVTRVAEVCNNAGNAQVFNDSEGVLFAEISSFSDTSVKAITLGDGTSNNRIQLFYFNGLSIYGACTAGGVSQASIFGNVNVSSNIKVAFKYKINDFALWVNGFEVGVDTIGTVPTGLNTLSFDNGLGASNFYGSTKQIQYYNTALSDSELEYMTSYRSLSEMVTELNLNAL